MTTETAHVERNPFFQSHAVFDAEHPDELEYAQSAHQYRLAKWLQTHDDLDGFTPLRQFPCRGTLRIFDRTDTSIAVCCDVCHFSTSAKVHTDQPHREREPF